MNLVRGKNQLSPTLVSQQNLDQERIDRILDIHDEKDELIEKLIFAPILPQWKVQEFVLELEDLEFMAQKLWKFPQDKTKHTWYMQLDHCSCDKSMEYFGKERPINPKCRLHGVK